METLKIWHLYSIDKLQIKYAYYLKLYMETRDNKFYNKMNEIRMEIFK